MRSALGILLLAATAVWLWDISWQLTLPSRAFLAPPHLATGLLVTAAGAAAAWNARPRLLPRSLGIVAAVGALGALAIDAWWHGARPAVPEILTLPHVLMAAALFLALAAALMLALSERPGRGSLLRVEAVALILIWLTVMGAEYLGRPNLWHGSEFYLVASAVFPAILVSASALCGRRWGATLTTGAYFLLMTGLFVGADALLSPLAARISGDPLRRLVPPAVPLLLVLPAVVIDVTTFVRRARRGLTSNLVTCALVGVSFVASMLALHWLAADVLLNDPRAPVLLGVDRWPYHAEVGDWRYQQWTLDPGRRPFAAGLGIANMVATVSGCFGLWAGRRLTLVRAAIEIRS
jgi:hypothetical protein